ncbi:MAG: lysine transporter LysE [Bacteroidetes bacterium HGW-Bacteroidetes-4]|jgi:threonine/homoserine/homoserine lactone efflux protein|nr:MAG: lysine transporter LysE [Bacteroidetes bacterium HGW-Bacteroidetes-4]
MNIEFFLKGLLVGIIVSAPMGPIGVLCVQKTVNKGRAIGFLSGLGAATADTVYAILAAFGVTFITNFLSKNQELFQVIGIMVLIFLGFRMIFNNPVKQYRYHRTSSKKMSAVRDYISVFFLTISNPLTIIFFGAAFTMLGLLTQIEGQRNNLLLVAGIFAGASLWWFALTYIVNIFRKRFRLRNIFILNRASGVIIVFLSILAVIKFFFL